MKRRLFVKGLVAAPAVPVVLSQRAEAQAPAVPDVPPLQFAGVEAAGDRVVQFFDARQFATLQRLCDILEPSVNNAPSANEARVPEFLDFLLQESERERQLLYLEGLDLLEHQAQDRFNRSFAQTEQEQAAELLGSLRQPWTPDTPDRLTEFLRDARSTVRTATRNSYEWDRAGRGSSGTYWRPV